MLATIGRFSDWLASELNILLGMPLFCYRPQISKGIQGFQKLLTNSTIQTVLLLRFCVS